MRSNIRDRIRALRKEKGLSALQVARRLGISRPYYTQLEGEKGRLSVDHLEKIINGSRMKLREQFGPTQDGDSRGEKARQWGHSSFHSIGHLGVAES